MESGIALAALCIGAAAGGAAAWLLVRARARADRVGLEERLRSEEERGREMRAALDEAQRREADLDARLRGEAERRAAAEEKNSRIGDLEATLAKRDARIEELHKASAEAQSAVSALRTELADERRAMEEKQAVFEHAEKRLSDAFRALASNALETSNKSFLELARATLEKYQQGARSELDKRRSAIDEMVKPLRESLGKMDEQMQHLRKERAESLGNLSRHIDNLQRQGDSLLRETQNLVNALKRPQARGRWGEMQLRRVVELAGMVEHCDFEEQVTLSGEEGRLRPDMIIHLPGGRTIVVDAKTSLDGYLAAVEATDEAARREALATHARQVGDHLAQLAGKKYWQSLPRTVEFVVMFLPGESFFNAAVEQEPALIERGMASRVVIATPMTLIALLRAVAYGWTQEQLTENAEQISNHGRELYERIRVLGEHFGKVGRELGQAVDAYNRAVGSLESRVLVSARRLAELGAGSDKEIESLEPLAHSPRSIEAPDLLPDDGEKPTPEATRPLSEKAD